MQRKSKSYLQGFTLLEMLLVIVISMSVVYLGVIYMQQKARDARVDRTVLQIQQILAAATAYYIDNGKWPPDQWDGTLSYLKPNYLPNSTVTSPYGTQYWTYKVSDAGLFYVYAGIGSWPTGLATEANMIAGRLPLGFASQNTPDLAVVACTSTSYCIVSAAINVPIQNINKSMAMNFAGLYHHGACVPVPTCPVDAGGSTMTPQVILIPVSISGYNDSTNIYPLTSVSAYAKGPGTNTTPDNCDNAGGYTASYSTGSTDCSAANLYSGAAATKYWRACVKIVTERGDITATRSDNAWAQFITLAAFTRCAIPSESAGSTFSVYSN